MKVVIIDYGMGNIKSISSALKYLGVSEIIVSNQRDVLLAADKLIFPGVGSFSEAMGNIKQQKIDRYLKEAVISGRKPILGICLGMQLLCESSQEGGLTSGLGFIPGVVEKFDASTEIKVPHVGFNQVNIKNNSRLFEGLENMSDFYFTHSFKLQSNVNINETHCNYGSEFIASYEVSNIAGVQFHPELSQTNGLKLMDNFIKNF